MPHFTLTLGPDGPIIAMFVGASGPRIAALTAAGQLPPSPIAIRALVDTGASTTCIDPAHIARLGLTPTGVATVHTPTTQGTAHPLRQFDIGLIIQGNTANDSLVRSVLPVIESHLSSQGIDALLGRDVLDQCVLIYNGDQRTFTLAF